MWKGSADQDFGEWPHKVRTSMLARFGDEILTALTWAARQRKIVVKTCVASQRAPSRKPHEHSDIVSGLTKAIKIHSGSGASACASTVKREWRLLSKRKVEGKGKKGKGQSHMQEAFQQTSSADSSYRSCWRHQLQFESARAQTAEQERSAIDSNSGSDGDGAMRTNRGDAMGDRYSCGKGSADQDFGEWPHKVRTSMLARFGDEHSHCSNVGSTTAKDRCQDLRQLRRGTALYPGITVFGGSRILSIRPFA